MEEIIKILSSLRPEIDFTVEDHLIDQGILDSFDIISLVGEIEEQLGVEIGVENLTPENFNSPKAIHQLVERLANVQ
jgi:D-alanine--poly(phosphoribitol) ligase subunit 2